MPYAVNQGVRIHYEVEGEGPPLVLLHGLGASLEFWRITGYVEALVNDYRLMLVDPRGHGSSDKPHDPEAYRMAVRVSDIVSVLDACSISKAHFCGYSMGGWTGWGIAGYAPERFHSLMIGGCSPLGNALEGPGFLDVFKQGMGAVLAAAEYMFGSRWTPAAKAMFSANDLQALIALLSLQEDFDVERLLPTIDLPCLLFGGASDALYAGAEECARRMTNATSISLPGVDHFEAQYRPDLMLPHIREFLAEVPKGGGGW
jgi:pimeloyl-ACP methyl ester carboxylesterase